MPLTGFRIPNDSSSFDDAQTELHEADVQQFILGHTLTGVVSGCAVTAQGTPDQTVAVAAGIAIVNGKAATVASGNVSLAAADGSNPRYDLIVVDNAGAKSKVDGTAAANPDKPDVPADRAILAEVWRPASDNTVETDKIVDKRVFIRPQMSEARMKASGGTIYYSVPGVSFTNQLSAALTAANRDHYSPFYVTSTLTIDLVVLDVLTAGAGGTTARCGIFQANEDWQPTARMLDSGTIDVASTGTKTASVSVTLPPGRYLQAINSDAAPSVRVHRGRCFGHGAIPTTLGGNLIDRVYVARTYAAFPDPGTAWDTSAGGGSEYYYWFLFRVSDIVSE
jgi:hypothetical protein